MTVSFPVGDDLTHGFRTLVGDDALEARTICELSGIGAVKETGCAFF